MAEQREVTLSMVLGSERLTSLNEVLTQAMRQQQQQALIKDSNLGKIVDAVVDLAAQASADEELFAAAILGRIAAVARGREAEVYERASELFSQEPPSIETLPDGDAKEYAAKMLGFADAGWLAAYCAREAMAIDTANNARKELLRTLLNSCDNLATFLRHLVESSAVVKSIDSAETRIRRVRRILESVAEVVRSFEGEVGPEPGAALASLVVGLASGATDVDSDALYASLDAASGVLVRAIELRYSHALQGETYQLLQDGKRLLTHGIWARYLDASKVIPKLRLNLLETAIVLARQNRTDKEILRAMEAGWPSTTLITSAIRQHFKDAVDIDPQIADYWMKVGRVSQSERAAEHKLGNTEDQQIGELLIQLDANREIMSKLNSAVVPVLKTFDAYQAATVQRAATGYEGIAQVAERLARMRKLSKSDLYGQVVEYNPIEHDMEGGHRSGIRRVRVVRDGIMKEFGGKKKTLVKPRVEPEE